MGWNLGMRVKEKKMGFWLTLSTTTKWWRYQPSVRLNVRSRVGLEDNNSERRNGKFWKFTITGIPAEAFSSADLMAHEKPHTQTATFISTSQKQDWHKTTWKVNARRRISRTPKILRIHPRENKKCRRTKSCLLPENRWFVPAPGLLEREEIHLLRTTLFSRHENYLPEYHHRKTKMRFQRKVLFKPL